jgi:Flp pilus assembly protein TadB
VDSIFTIIVLGIAGLAAILPIAVVQSITKPTSSEKFEDAIAILTGQSANEIDTALNKGPSVDKKSWAGFWLDAVKKSGRIVNNEAGPGQFALTLVGLGIFFGLLVYPGGLVGALVAPLVALVLMYAFLGFEQGKRRGTLEKQLPLVLASLRTQMMAGVTIQGAIMNVADELPSPIGDEFRQVKADVAVSIPLEDALATLATRIKSRLLFFLVSSIGIALRSGSDLIPQLVTIEEIVRQRARIEGKIKSALAFAKPTSYLAMGAPLLMGGYLFLTDISYPVYFFGEGILLLGIAVVMYAAGIFAIQMIVKNVEKV